MILSQLLLNKADLIQLRISDVYSLHRIVYDCFPLENAKQKTTTPASFLFCDKGIKKNQREIIILSQTPPRAPACGVLESKQVPDRLLEFSRYRFAITINSVKREKKDKAENNPKHKLVSIIGQQEVHKWFVNKAPNWGFSVQPETLEIDETGVWNFEKTTNNKVTLAYAKIGGLLEVTDRELFIKSFKQGIGRAKTFGCGLLQIAAVA